jgi:membrane protein YqaA with SNARE-associated domain
MAYISLFMSAFLAATLLPFSSEIILGTLVLSGKYNVMGLWIGATLGNVAGSIVNWLLGRYFIHLIGKKRFPVTQTEMEQAEKVFLKYGVWTLLLAWLPVVGDPLTFVAGVFRVPIVIFLTLVLVGKGSRYFVVIYFLI